MTIRLASLQRPRAARARRSAARPRAGVGRALPGRSHGGARGLGRAARLGRRPRPPTASTSPADRARFDAPVPRPAKVFAIGLNYRRARRGGRARHPETPMVFTKFPELPRRAPRVACPVVGVRRLRGRAGRRDRPARQGGRRRAGARGRRRATAPGRTSRTASCSSATSRRSSRSASRSTASGRSGPEVVSLDALRDPNDLEITLRRERRAPAARAHHRHDLRRCRSWWRTCRASARSSPAT